MSLCHPVGCNMISCNSKSYGSFWSFCRFFNDQGVVFLDKRLGHYVYIYEYECVCACACVHIYMYKYLKIWMQIYVFIYIYTYIIIHMCVRECDFDISRYR